MRLPDFERSRALLIGASAYADPELNDLPAVANNLTDLADVLTDPNLGGIRPDHCVVMSNDSSIDIIGQRLEEAAADAEDLLLVYYAGHGLLVGPSGELHLCIASTRQRYARWTALPFSRVREVVNDSIAANRVVILDCCFSGRALPVMADPSSLVPGQVEIKGCYTLTSAPANMPAHAPPGERHTAFTGQLLTLLLTGDADGPDFMTLQDIYRSLVRSLRARGLPEPQQLGTATVAQLALARNAATIHRATGDLRRGEDLRYDLTITLTKPLAG